MNGRHRLIVLRLLSMLWMVAVVAGCGQTPIIPTSVAEPSGRTIVEVDDIAFKRVILIGKAANIDAVVAEYNRTRPADEQLVNPREITLGFLAGVSSVAPTNPPSLSQHPKIRVRNPFRPADFPDVVRLYDFPEKLDISLLPDALQELNILGNGRVFADLEYKISDPSTHEVCADPHSGGGSPFGALGLNVPAEAFRKQWALEAISALPESDDSVTGSGVNIVFFDTWGSPPFEGSENFPLPGGKGIRVLDSIAKYQASDTTLPPETEAIDLSWHGEAVAGVTAAMARDSTYSLYRILDKQACGSIWTWVGALSDLLQEILIKGQRNVIASASAGIHYVPPDSDLFELELGKKLPTDIAVFQFMLDVLYGQGVIFIAAAGNDSAPATSDSPVAAQKMQFPANYNLVIGVAATSKDGKRSCFSNQGDIAAPGGNGGWGENQDQSQNPCAPRTETALVLPEPCDLPKMEVCPYGTIVPSSYSPTGYGLVSGTSFATPFVTSELALVMQRADGNLELVFCMIREGTHDVGDQDLGKGIINIGRSLSDVTMTECQFPLPQ